MGALNGSLSYVRFLVDGDLPKNPGAALEKSIESRRFLPLSPTQETPESAGWVATEAPYDDGRPITRDLFLFGDLVVLTYREDKWAVPRPLLKRETQKRLQKIIDEEKKDPDSIGKAFIKAVEQAVLVELKQKTFPRSKLIDVVWDTKRREARVFGRGTVVTERVASLFERTFGARVEVGVYAARAFSLDLGTRAQGVLERLSPGWLFPDALQAAMDEARESLAGADEEAASASPVSPPAPLPAKPKQKAGDDDTPPWDN